MGDSEVLNHIPEQPLEKTEAGLLQAVNEALDSARTIQKQYSETLDTIRNLFGLVEPDYTELVERTVQAMEKDNVSA
jgi:hypothetical protein